MKILDTIGFVEGFDPEVGKAMGLELARQKRNLELIASENIVSPAVMAAMGSALTNKYAEGYPSKRYYGGCECVDIVENIAIERACKLFDCKFANVQPHSGAPGLVDAPVLMTSRTELSAQTAAQLKRLKPKKIIVCGASAYPRVIDFERISNVAKEVGAYFMVDMAHIAGLVATGMHPSPLPYADVVTTTTHKTLRGPRGGMILTNSEELAKKFNKAIFPGTQGGPLMHVIAGKAVCLGEALSDEFKAYGKQVVANADALAKGLLKRGFNLVSGGTDNHLMLVDLQPFNITGKELEKKLDEVYITVNKNAIPNDPQSPFVTSGVRIGTPAVTTRGLVEEDMEKIAEFIYLTASDFENNADKIREGVGEICKKYPLYE